MESMNKQYFSCFCNDDEFKEICDAIEKARSTENGKLRKGDMIANVLLSWARTVNKK